MLDASALLLLLVLTDAACAVVDVAIVVVVFGATVREAAAPTECGHPGVSTLGIATYGEYAC